MKSGTKRKERRKRRTGPFTMEMFSDLVKSYRDLMIKHLETPLFPFVERKNRKRRKLRYDYTPQESTRNGYGLMVNVTVDRNDGGEGTLKHRLNKILELCKSVPMRAWGGVFNKWKDILND